MNTQFSCVGCGKCCSDHHVPLTLAEARMWAADGGSVIVLVEGFLGNGLGLPQQQREHAERRSVVVPSGNTEAYVAITFAAYNAGRCRDLDEDNRGGIYERRPLVCRIYPMENNPHIPLNPGAKDCPPESWEQGPALVDRKSTRLNSSHGYISDAVFCLKKKIKQKKTKNNRLQTLWLNHLS